MISASVGAVGLHRLDVVEATEAAGDVARRQRLTFERRDDADHVDRAVGGDDRHEQLLRVEPEHLGGDATALARRSLQLARHRRAVHTARGDHEERSGMDRHERSRRQHRPLHTLLTTVGQERAEVAEVAERLAVLGALRTDRDRVADLGDDDAEFAGRHLHPRVLGDRVHRPQLEPQTGHEQRGLIAGLPVQGDRVAVREAAPREPLVDESDLGRADDSEGPRHHEGGEDDDEQ